MSTAWKIWIKWAAVQFAAIYCVRSDRIVSAMKMRPSRLDPDW
jgi:hypothetical protein